MSETDFVIEDGVLKKYQGVGETAVIPAGVTAIWASAFADCIHIREVQIPEGVTKIVGYAFRGCTGLTHLELPEGLTEIGNDAFETCEGLRSVKFPASLKTIGSMAFSHCKNLEAVDLPDGVESIGFMAFHGCPLLKRLEAPASVTYFGGGFYGCTGLEEVVVLGKVDISNNYTFNACHAALILPQIDLSSLDAVTKIHAVTGFALALERGIAYAPEVQAGYLKYLKSQRKRLYSVILEHESLLRLMFEEKLIPVKEVELLLKEAGKNNAVKALILEYQKRYLSPADPLAELKKGMGQVERQAKRAAKQAAKTPEQLAAEQAEKERKAKEKREKALEDFKKTGELPPGIAKELWSYKKRSDGTLCITSWKGECGKMKTNGGVGFEGKPEDVVIPRMIGKTAVTALEYTFHTTRIGSINNVWQRRYMQAVIVPEGVEEIGDAFDGCFRLRRLVLPASLKKIYDFYDTRSFPKLTVYAPAGSWAESWAKERGFPVKTPEDGKGD